MSKQKALEFKKNKYCIVESGLSPETIKLITQYALFDEMQKFSPENGQQQVPGAHSRYADPMMESLLLALHPVIEKNTGLKLHPTYSYYRVYRPGDELKIHKDRESCEISLTLSFEYDYLGETNPWPIFIDGNPISLSPGQMAIYRGIDLNHWREKFEAPEGSWHVQAFLHYVDVNGEYPEFKYDKRPSVGFLDKNKSNNDATKNINKKSYIEYTK